MTPVRTLQPASIVIGLVVAVGAVVALVVMMRPVTLTYAIRYGNEVEVECQSLWVPHNDFVRAPAIEVRAGTVYVLSDTEEGLASIYHPEGEDHGGETVDPEADDVLATSAAALSADCARGRAERNQWTWLPAVGLALGLGLAWSGRGRRTTPPPPALPPSGAWPPVA